MSECINTRLKARFVQIGELSALSKAINTTIPNDV